MAALPTGTAHFSSPILRVRRVCGREHAEAMKAALARHDEILRDAIVANDGQVVKMPMACTPPARMRLMRESSSSARVNDDPLSACESSGEGQRIEVRRPK
jgi:hypothetical protein